MVILTAKFVGEEPINGYKPGEQYKLMVKLDKAVGKEDCPVVIQHLVGTHMKAYATKTDFLAQWKIVEGHL